MGPSDLAQVLRCLPPVIDRNVLVGLEWGDDAAVYRTPSGDLLVATLDFFTPVVDDPYDFGRVAAANSLSDVYAMGGRPLFALSIVAWPVKLGMEGLGRVLAGGGDVAKEAGAGIIGGHSIDDPVPKFGLVVIGIVDPAQLTANNGARAGDELWLTKPLGSGAMTGALKRGTLGDAELKEVTRVMTTLNRDAALAMNAAGVRAATDITGFGLLGHLHKMMLASGVDAFVNVADLPVIAGARPFYDRGEVPGGTKRNLAFFGPHVTFAPSVTDADRLLVSDAQTSGGLLVCVPPAARDTWAAEIAQRGVVAARIGGVLPASAGGAGGAVSFR